MQRGLGSSHRTVPLRALRRQNIEELDTLITAWCAQRERSTALSELTAAGCAVGPLETVATLLDNPQVVHRGSIATVHDDNLGDLAMTGAYPHFQAGGTAIGRPGPATVGQDTDVVLTRDLGLREHELSQLRAAGVLGGLAHP